MSYRHLHHTLRILFLSVAILGASIAPVLGVGLSDSTKHDFSNAFMPTTKVSNGDGCGDFPIGYIAIAPPLFETEAWDVDGKWLPCDGREVEPGKYPELAKILKENNRKDFEINGVASWLKNGWTISLIDGKCYYFTKQSFRGIDCYDDELRTPNFNGQFLRGYTQCGDEGGCDGENTVAGTRFDEMLNEHELFGHVKNVLISPSSTTVYEPTGGILHTQETTTDFFHVTPVPPSTSGAVKINRKMIYTGGSNDRYETRPVNTMVHYMIKASCGPVKKEEQEQCPVCNCCDFNEWGGAGFECYDYRNEGREGGYYYMGTYTEKPKCCGMWTGSDCWD